MKRFYYTDPLAAAWMAKHFGMRMSYRNGCEINRIICNSEESQAWQKIYLHPDSEESLSIQPGDVFVEGGNVGIVPIDDNNAQGEAYFCGTEIPASMGNELVYIIQRNGIPFMWPECEDE